MYRAWRCLRRFFWRTLGFRNWVFLDDTRDPPEHLSKVFDTVRSHGEFKRWVDRYGIPDLVSFDHDLHAEHVAFFFERGGFGNPPDPSNEIFLHPTGYDSAKWFLEACSSEGVYPRHVLVHSRNPAGSDRIFSLVTGYTQENRLEITCRKTRWGRSPKSAPTSKAR